MNFTLRHRIRRFAIGILSLVALDFLWLGTIASDFYSSRIGPHLNLVDGVMQAKPFSAFLTWILIVLGIELLALPLAAARRSRMAAAAGYGGLFGFITYGIYELTNHALFHSWPPVVVAVDMAWGTILCSTVALIMVYSNRSGTAGT